MYGGNREGGWLFVFVMHFVEVLVEEGGVVEPMRPKSAVILPKYNFTIYKIILTQNGENLPAK